MANDVLKLTPREYYDMTWNLVVSNRLDTVSGEAIINRVDVEPTEFYTASTTTGELPDGTVVNFPLDENDNTKPTHWLYEGLDHKMFWGGRVWNASRARQEFIWAHGKVHIAPDVPIEGQPTLTMSLHGNTYKMRYPNSDNNVSTDTIPNKGVLKSDNSICSWIKSNIPKSSMTKEEGQLFNMDSDDIWLHTTTCALYDASPAWGAEGDKEAWMRSICFMYMPDTEGTIERASNFGWNNGAGMRYNLWHKYNVLSGVTFLRASLKQIAVREYEIEWEAPIKVAGLGASRKDNFWGAEGDQYGCMAYINSITSVNFSLSARPFNTEKTTFAWSIDKNNNLTNELSNLYPLNLEGSEVITLGSTMNGKVWTEEMPRTLMSKYKEGKHYIQTKVNAKWLIDNNVHINTLVQIVNINGVPIGRKGVPCTFLVKNIIKEYTDQAFTFTLSCLEV